MKLCRSKGYFVVSSDTIRMGLNGGEYPKQSGDNRYKAIEPLVWSLCAESVSYFLNNSYRVIVDAMNLTDHLREYWAKIGNSFGLSKEQIQVVICNGDWDSAKRWVEQRGIAVDEYEEICKRIRSTPLSVNESSFYKVFSSDDFSGLF